MTYHIILCIMLYTIISRYSFYFQSLVLQEATEHLVLQKKSLDSEYLEQNPLLVLQKKYSTPREESFTCSSLRKH